MPETSYIAFIDTFAGFKQIPKLTASSIDDVVKKIDMMPSPNFMTYIYKSHQSNLPILGTKFDTYIFVKAIAGSKMINPNTNMPHQYALTHNSSMAWFFTDNMFE